MNLHYASRLVRMGKMGGLDRIISGSSSDISDSSPSAVGVVLGYILTRIAKQPELARLMDAELENGGRTARVGFRFTNDASKAVRQVALFDMGRVLAAPGVGGRVRLRLNESRCDLDLAENVDQSPALQEQVDGFLGLTECVKQDT